MIGFVIGTLCLIVLVRMHRIRRRIYAAGCGLSDFGGHPGWHGHHGPGHHGPGHHGWGGGHHWRGGGWGQGGGWFGGSRQSFMLRGLFERLQTTPGQEKVIIASVDEVVEAVKGARGEVDLTRKDVARAFTAPSFDAELIGHTFARHDDAMDGVRRAVTGALAKIHDALDERQRGLLAEMLDKGTFGGRGFGFHPYR